MKSWLVENRSASQSIFVTEYESLITDPAGELAALGEQLGLRFSAEEIEIAIAASSLSRMRELEDSFSARNPVYGAFGLEFVRKGKHREMDEFNPEIMAFILSHTETLYSWVRSRILTPNRM